MIRSSKAIRPAPTSAIYAQKLTVSVVADDEEYIVQWLELEQTKHPVSINEQLEH